MKKTLDILFGLSGISAGVFLVYVALRKEPGVVIWPWLIVGVFIIIIDIYVLWKDFRKRNI